MIQDVKLGTHRIGYAISKCAFLLGFGGGGFSFKEIIHKFNHCSVLAESSYVGK